MNLYFISTNISIIKNSLTNVKFLQKKFKRKIYNYKIVLFCPLKKLRICC